MGSSSPLSLSLSTSAATCPLESLSLLVHQVHQSPLAKWDTAVCLTVLWVCLSSLVGQTKGIDKMTTLDGEEVPVSATGILLYFIRLPFLLRFQCILSSAFRRRRRGGDPVQEVQGLRFSFRAHYDRGQLRLNTFGHVLAGIPCCRPIYQILNNYYTYPSCLETGTKDGKGTGIGKRSLGCKNVKRFCQTEIIHRESFLQWPILVDLWKKRNLDSRTTIFDGAICADLTLCAKWKAKERAHPKIRLTCFKHPPFAVPVLGWRSFWACVSCFFLSLFYWMDIKMIIMWCGWRWIKLIRKRNVDEAELPRIQRRRDGKRRVHEMGVDEKEDEEE